MLYLFAIFEETFHIRLDMFHSRIKLIIVKATEWVGLSSRTLGNLKQFYLQFTMQIMHTSDFLTSQGAGVWCRSAKHMFSSLVISNAAWVILHTYQH